MHIKCSYHMLISCAYLMHKSHNYTPITYTHTQQQLTFSQSGSINVNKSLVLSLVFTTSAPSALPNIISPANFDAFIAISRSEESVSSVGRDCEFSAVAVDMLLCLYVTDAI